MEKPSRKRGRKSKNAVDAEANPNSTTTATTSTAIAADDVLASLNAATDTAATDRRGSKRRRKTGKEKADDVGIVASPERRASRHSDHNGDCDIVTAVAEGPTRWESVGKVVPSMDAVVKVFCVHTEPNFSLPWQRKRQYSSSSSGFIIGGRRVLTNAHSVEHHTQVKVKKRGSDTKYLATVLAIGTECDIAMLTVSDDEFWEGISPLDFGDLPALQDAVTVVGYPIGGDTISVTSGVVSRIEILSYVHGSTELLGLQIDAAINSGNSGGPAFNDKGECVGIAFQSLKHEDAENIGYVIPTPVIMHFIQDYEKNGEYTGFPILGVEWQKMENPDLRMSMGMGNEHKGVRIKRIEPTAPESNVLRPSDVILSFDGVNVANDGTGYPMVTGSIESRVDKLELEVHSMKETVQSMKKRLEYLLKLRGIKFDFQAVKERTEDRTDPLPDEFPEIPVTGNAREEKETRHQQLMKKLIKQGEGEEATENGGTDEAPSTRCLLERTQIASLRSAKCIAVDLRCNSVIRLMLSEKKVKKSNLEASVTRILCY